MTIATITYDRNGHMVIIPVANVTPKQLARLFPATPATYAVPRILGR